MRYQPSVLRPRSARRPLCEEEADAVGVAPRVRRGWQLRAAARPHRRPDGESGLEEPSARSLRQLYMEIYTRGPFFADNATEHIGSPRGRPVKGFAALRIVAHCFHPDARSSTKGLIRQDSLPYGACCSSVEECFGIRGCPSYRALGCLAKRCGDCCKALGLCTWHQEQERKRAALLATRDP